LQRWKAVCFCHEIRHRSLKFLKKSFFICCFWKNLDFLIQIEGPQKIVHQTPKWEPDFMSAITILVIFMTIGRWFLYGTKTYIVSFFSRFFLILWLYFGKNDTTSARRGVICYHRHKKLTLHRPTWCHFFFFGIKSGQKWHNFGPT
jgi:hypothetical protein